MAQYNPLKHVAKIVGRISGFPESQTYFLWILGNFWTGRLQGPGPRALKSVGPLGALKSIGPKKFRPKNMKICLKWVHMAR